MKVVWKDSSTAAKEYKTTTYRKHVITWYTHGRLRGWTTDIEGDDNVYRSLHSAYNAIDAVLGGMPRRTCEKRQAKGIDIVGKKE